MPVNVPQRLRFVLALGAVNLVLAAIAFGIAGSVSLGPDAAGASPVP